MKVLIELDDDMFKDIRESDFESARIIVRNFQATIADAIRSGTPIPDNATNGDAIKAIFPDCKDWKARFEDDDGEAYEVHFVQLPISLTVNKYAESWWNAPYKADRKE